MIDQRRYGIGQLDGLIGSRILRCFTVWLDYVHLQIVLVPNADARN